MFLFTELSIITNGFAILALSVHMEVLFQYIAVGYLSVAQGSHSFKGLLQYAFMF